MFEEARDELADFTGLEKASQKRTWVGLNSELTWFELWPSVVADNRIRAVSDLRINSLRILKSFLCSLVKSLAMRSVLCATKIGGLIC